MCCHHYSDRHTADNSLLSSQPENMWERRKILTPMSTLESSVSPAGLSWSRCARSLYCVHDIFASSACPHPHALTKSQSQALVRRNRLRACHRRGVDTGDLVLWAVQLPPELSDVIINCLWRARRLGENPFPLPCRSRTSTKQTYMPLLHQRSSLTSAKHNQRSLHAALPICSRAVDHHSCCLFSPITLQHKLWMFFCKISHKCLKRASLQRETKTWRYFISVC